MSTPLPLDNGCRDDSRPPRRFFLRRTKDETGISRTGRVLEGVLMQSGKVFVEWRPPHSTIGIYNSLDEFRTIHVDCHPSCNEIVWLDEPTCYCGATPADPRCLTMGCAAHHVPVTVRVG